ncbi:hypothetical protein CMO96_01515 [Candidatus Woesebacteria bacterium]|nr:hypothetical protein [Candidatus Woesebacteria bacterium]
MPVFWHPAEIMPVFWHPAEINYPKPGGLWYFDTGLCYLASGEAAPHPQVQKLGVFGLQPV